MRRHAISALALAASLLPGAAPAHATPDLPAEGASIELRFLNAPEDGGPIERSPTLRMSFGGDDVRAIMDTGSTGILVSASAIPNIDSLPSLGAGELTYTSSGRVMRGTWVRVPVTISGREGASVTTRPMPVLAVRRIDCLDKARNCTPEDAPQRVAMMGVGFGREGDRQATGTPDHNPFMHIATDRPMHRGYVITRHGVRLGLTARHAEGFRFIKLKRKDDVPDWAGMSACIQVNAGGPFCGGTALIDTGVTDMFLTIPPYNEGERDLLQNGDQISVFFGDPQGPYYSFILGARGQPSAPRKLVPVGGRNKPTFVNTGVHVLNSFDYLFDAEGGHVGLRPVKGF